MNIFKQIKNSIYSKDYYNGTVLTETFGDSIKYLLKISVIVALVFAIVFAIASPFISRGLKDGLGEVLGMYPNNLTISIQNGSATINQPEPYFIKVSKSMGDLKDEEAKKSAIENLIVINTSEPFNIDKFKSYNTLALLTKNEVVMMSNSGEIKIEKLSIFGNVEITKTWLENKENKAHKIMPWAFVGMTLLVFGGMLSFEFIGGLIVMLFYALIVLGLLKLKGYGVSYKRAYQISIHAATLVLFLGVFIKGWEWSGILFRIFIFVIIIYFNFDNIVKLEPKKEEILELKEEGEVKKEFKE